MLVESSAGLGEIQSPLTINSPTSARTDRPVTPGAAIELSGPPLSSSSISRTLDNISRFHDWYILSETEGNLSESQAAEYSLNQLNQRFSHLLQSLSTSNSNFLAQKLEQWDSQRISEGVLNAQLEPNILQDKGAQTSYTLEKVDLLVPRAKDEQVTFFFRDNRSTISINLPANTGKSQLFNLIKSAFAKAGISANRTTNGLLELSIPESEKIRLEKPVFLTGEGYRIPAGNPLQMQLTQVPSLLQQLSLQLLSFTPDQLAILSARIENIRKRLKQRTERLRKYRKSKLMELQSHSFGLNEPDNLPEIGNLRQQINDVLEIGQYRFTNQVLVAQGNLSRRTVIALLSDFL